MGGSVASVVAEREQQTLKRLFISPLSGTSYFLGIFLAHSCIGIGQALLIYTISAFWAANFNGSIVLGGVIILLSIASYVGLGFILGTQLARRTEDVNALVAAFGVPLLILGGAFLPTSLFPKNLLDIAKFNPIYHMNEALLKVSADVFIIIHYINGAWRMAILSADVNGGKKALICHLSFVIRYLYE